MAALLSRAEAEKESRLEKERIQRERVEQAKRKARENYLKGLAADFPKVWEEVGQEVQLGTAAAYDRCLTRIKDLSDSYSLFSDRDHFKEALEQFMRPYMKRTALIRRLNEAGLWGAGDTPPGGRILSFK